MGTEVFTGTLVSWGCKSNYRLSNVPSYMNVKLHVISLFNFFSSLSEQLNQLCHELCLTQQR